MGGAGRAPPGHVRFPLARRAGGRLPGCVGPELGVLVGQGWHPPAWRPPPGDSTLVPVTGVGVHPRCGVPGLALGGLPPAALSSAGSALRNSGRRWAWPTTSSPASPCTGPVATTGSPLLTTRRSLARARAGMARAEQARRERAPYDAVECAEACRSHSVTMRDRLHGAHRASCRGAGGAARPRRRWRLCGPACRHGVRGTRRLGRRCRRSRRRWPGSSPRGMGTPHCARRAMRPSASLAAGCEWAAPGLTPRVSLIRGLVRFGCCDAPLAAAVVADDPKPVTSCNHLPQSLAHIWKAIASRSPVHRRHTKDRLGWSAGPTCLRPSRRPSRQHRPRPVAGGRRRAGAGEPRRGSSPPHTCHAHVLHKSCTLLTHAARVFYTCPMCDPHVSRRCPTYAQHPYMSAAHA